MIRFDQWWLPDGETHLQDWMFKANRRVHRNPFPGQWQADARASNHGAHAFRQRPKNAGQRIHEDLGASIDRP